MIPEYAAVVVVSALILDMLFGDPPSRYHPTAWVGRIYGKIIPHFRIGKMRTEIALGAASVIAVCCMLASLLFTLEYAVSTLLEGTVMVLVLIISSTLLLKSTIAIRGMQEHAMRVIESLDAGDIKCARGNLAMIVKRRTGNLEHEHLVSGTLESISENTSDGITGPMFYFALFGLPGAFVYRAVNTADSMIGYKNGIFSNLGRFTAACDTVLNYLPSRLTAYAMIFSAAILGMDWKNSYRIVKKHGSCTQSMNAGYPMAALAGALNITLEKPGHYTICGGTELLKTAHVRDALRIMKTCTIIFCASFVLPIIMILSYAGWWVYV